MGPMALTYPNATAYQSPVDPNSPKKRIVKPQKHKPLKTLFKHVKILDSLINIKPQEADAAG